MTLNHRATHLDLADMVGAAREPVTVAVGRLQEHDEIGMRERTVIIRRMDDQSLTATEIA
ncbi:MAG: helix-turn-helix domain-containing protein [Actinobacteria bacterium]|nr:helix-turn-helix domain-containing protein [Actinomycetota bacterium]